MTKYIPHKPTPKQTAFLVLPHREAMYGGQAGGGKSDALLMGALQYVDTPGYAAIIFRRTYTDLALPGAIMARSKEWLYDSDAKWNEDDKTWTFPSGAYLVFAYLKSSGDEYRYQSAEFQYVAFDELTQFQENMYTYLFSRLRRLKGSSVPLRMRSASNPGGVGHDWVRRRFLSDEAEQAGRIFIPAGLEDNPFIDKYAYEMSLAQVSDPTVRRQLREGDWDAQPPGEAFKREWFNVTSVHPRGDIRWCRFWDLAGTEPGPGKDPDYTVGLRMGLHLPTRNVYITGIERHRKTPGAIKRIVKQTAITDGHNVRVRMEQEPGSAGKGVIDEYARSMIGYDFKGDRATGPKQERWAPLAQAAEQGMVYLVQSDQCLSQDAVRLFLNEAGAVPEGHDDQIDAASGAYKELASMPEADIF